MLRIRDALREHVPGLDEQTAGRRTVVALSSILFPACFAELYRPLRSLDSARERRAYLEEIVQQLLAAAPSDRGAERRPDTYTAHGLAHHHDGRHLDLECRADSAVYWS